PIAYLIRNLSSRGNRSSNDAWCRKTVPSRLQLQLLHARRNVREVSQRPHETPVDRSLEARSVGVSGEGQEGGRSQQYYFRKSHRRHARGLPTHELPPSRKRIKRTRSLQKQAAAAAASAAVLDSTLHHYPGVVDDPLDVGRNAGVHAGHAVLAAARRPVRDDADLRQPLAAKLYRQRAARVALARIAAALARHADLLVADEGSIHAPADVIRDDGVGGVAQLQAHLVGRLGEVVVRLGAPAGHDRVVAGQVGERVAPWREPDRLDAGREDERFRQSDECDVVQDGDRVVARVQNGGRWLNRHCRALVDRQLDRRLPGNNSRPMHPVQTVSRREHEPVGQDGPTAQRFGAVAEAEQYRHQIRELVVLCDQPAGHLTPGWGSINDQCRTVHDGIGGGREG
uniref:Uncharacterized protein n=1 Tax=Anopheles atroparvus TaxID=41427 RepID=A0AAG5DDW9_ANOAO